ncbi:MAG: signal peptide peptidase SppA [Candidatus Paracaedibacteraceae bacterium]|nr:signal peptide peptidase SppA [Candidatus Paracaedibacteraceae bacterium]
MKKFILYFFASLGVLFLSLVLILGLSIKSLFSPSLLKVPNESQLYIHLSKQITDFPTRATFGFGSHSKPNVWNIARALKAAAHDSRIESAVIHMDFPLLTFSQAYSLGRSIEYFRSSGKKIKCYASSFGNLGGGLPSYFLATYCDEISLQRLGEVAINRVSEREVLGGEFIFIRELLDKLKITPDFMVKGRYKKAPEPLIYKTFSIENREMLSSLIKDLETQVLTKIIYNRPSKLKGGIDILANGPYLDAQALNLGIIDGISNKVESNEKFVLLEEYVYGLEKSEKKAKQTIAIVKLEGAIVDDGMAYGIREKVITPLYVKEIFETLHRLGNVRGVILSINSPGGSALASEKIWSVIKHFQTEYKVVVYMQRAAASGGYYIAAPANYIVANPFTLTGSIGVFTGKFVLKEMLKDLGVNSESLDRSNVSINSIFSRFTPKQKIYLQKNLEHTYNRFIEVVSDGRTKSKEEILSLAEGRVWTGNQAVGNGLVDQVGDLSDAVECLAKLLELESNSYQVKLIEPKGDFSAIIKEMVEQFDVSLSILSSSLHYIYNMIYGPGTQYKENF